MKRTLVMIVAACAATAALAAGPQPIRIKATKKTADTRSNTAVAARRTVEHSSKDLFYEIELARNVPNAPDQVTVKWAVVTLGMSGRHLLGTGGEKAVTMPKDRPAVVETDDFSLETKEVNVNRARVDIDSTSKEKLIGYGVRVLDDKGAVIAETIQPESARKSVLEAFDGTLPKADKMHDNKERRRNQN